VQNPKKQAVDTKLKAMACYLKKSDDLVTNQQRKGPWEHHRDWQGLGLGFQREVVWWPRRRGDSAMQARRGSGWRWCAAWSVTAGAAAM